MMLHIIWTIQIYFISKTNECIEQIKKDKETDWSMSCVFKSDSQNIGQEEELENEENRSVYTYTIL